MQTDQVYADKRLVINRTASPGRLSIMGALDEFNADAVAKVLEWEIQTTAGTQLRVDLSGVQFADTCGIRALFKVAENAGDRPIVLQGLPPRIRQVILLVGWGDVPGLLLAD